MTGKPKCTKFSIMGYDEIWNHHYNDRYEIN